MPCGRIHVLRTYSRAGDSLGARVVRVRLRMRVRLRVRARLRLLVLLRVRVQVRVRVHVRVQVRVRCGGCAFRGTGYGVRKDG